MPKGVYLNSEGLGLSSAITREIEKMKGEAEKSDGICSICGAKGALYSDVCESCFTGWVSPAAIKRVERES